ncbi:MAG: hypothetical protein ACO1QS_18410 [Verrucomicrobiota bacterium]
MTKEDELEAYLTQFQPHSDFAGFVSESGPDYAARMQHSHLPDWPAEPLIEWFHRHFVSLSDYAFLRFESLAFTKERWPLERIPGREAFADPKFCDAFQNIKERAASPYDWLAKYMLKHGTWNTPVLLLKTPARPVMSSWRLPLSHPYHLLEGHKRLSFMNALRDLGEALPEHDVWVVEKNWDI